MYPIKIDQNHVPNIPFDPKYIQNLGTSMMQRIIKEIDYILNRDVSTRISLPTLTISDKRPTKTYPSYNFSYILKAIDTLREKYDNSHFYPILSDIKGSIENRLNGYRFYDHTELNHYLENDIINSNPSPELTLAKKIYSALTSQKLKAARLGEFNPQTNTIILYPKNIVAHFRDIPCFSEEEKFMIGLETVLAHELFHAIHYNLMGDTDAQRERLWKCSLAEKRYKESVVEGLAKWFEYFWLDRQLHIKSLSEEINKELNLYDYPEWPYAAARAFVYAGEYSFGNVLDVFDASINQSPSHWRDSFERLDSFDPLHKKPKTFREALDEEINKDRRRFRR
jgi:hypothetical protein